MFSFWETDQSQQAAGGQTKVQSAELTVVSPFIKSATYTLACACSNSDGQDDSQCDGVGEWSCEGANDSTASSFIGRARLSSKMPELK
jgi:hypothetical protein